MSDMIVSPIKLNIIEKLNKIIDALNKDLSSLRTGRASATMLNSVKVDAYGSMVGIEEVATISASDARTLIINVWDKSLVSAVELGIRNSNLGLSPNIDGTKLRIALAAPTEESRKKLAKQTGEYAEKAKISIRQLRKEFLDRLKELHTKKEISEDELKLHSDHFEKDVKSFGAKVDDLAAKKAKEIMEL